MAGTSRTTDEFPMGLTKLGELLQHTCHVCNSTRGEAQTASS